MAKKDKDRTEKHDEELDDEHDEEGHDEDEEEEEAAVSAKPASSARSGRAQARARRAAKPVHDDEHDDHDDHDSHRSDDAYDDDDPYWWTPYSVMAGLVLIGILGFVGVFNKILGGIAAHPASADVPATSAMADAKPAMPTPQPPHPGGPPGGPMGQQGPVEMFGAKHLLVMYKGSRRAPPGIERSKEEAKKRAEEAEKKAKAPGAKFEDLVKEYSDEPGAAARGGDLGTFKKGSMVPEFQNALDKMKVGDVSAVVETPFGYHVILRTK